MKIFNEFYNVAVIELLCSCLLNHYLNCSIVFMLTIIFLLFQYMLLVYFDKSP